MECSTEALVQYADTVVDPGWLACVMERMAGSGAVLCRHRFDGPDAELIMWGTCAVRAEAFRRVRGYDEAIERWGMEDTDLYRRRLSLIGPWRLS